MDELKIIKYLDGEMTLDESRAFEEEIRMNPPLAEELERYRQIQDLARQLLDEGADEVSNPEVEKEISEAVQDFKNDPGSMDKVSPEYLRKLEEAQERFMGSRSSSDPGGGGESRLPGKEDVNANDPVSTIRKIWYRAAAVVILAIILSILLFRPFSKSTPDEIYAKYFHAFHKTEEVLEMARNDNDFLFAVEVYEAGDFERAAALFEMLADSSVIRSWALFYAANSYMSQNHSGRAIELYQTILAEGDREVQSHARWQLALSYLRIGEPDMAREQLEILSKDPVYRSDAKRILRIVY
jgi:hypothetical protein